MKNDPIVEEVRETRRKRAEKFQFDIKKIFADAKSREATSGHPLVGCMGRVCEDPVEYTTRPPWRDGRG